MAELKIDKVLSLPAVLAANTLYLVKSATPDLFDVYMSNSDGSAARHLATKDEVTSSVVLFGTTPPPLPNPVLLWWNTAEGTMYVQYNDGEQVYWVEAISSVAVPDFAGSGEASTMARSDHNHDNRYARIDGNHEW